MALKIGETQIVFYTAVEIQLRETQKDERRIDKESFIRCMHALREEAFNHRRPIMPMSGGERPAHWCVHAPLYPGVWPKAPKHPDCVVNVDFTKRRWTRGANTTSPFGGFRGFREKVHSVHTDVVFGGP